MLCFNSYTIKQSSSSCFRSLTAKWLEDDLSGLTYKFEEIAQNYFNSTHFVLVSSHKQNFVQDDSVSQQPRQ